MCIDHLFKKVKCFRPFQWILYKLKHCVRSKQEYYYEVIVGFDAKWAIYVISLQG